MLDVADIRGWVKLKKTSSGRGTRRARCAPISSRPTQTGAAYTPIFSFLANLAANKVPNPIMRVDTVPRCLADTIPPARLRSRRRLVKSGVGLDRGVWRGFEGFSRKLWAQRVNQEESHAYKDSTPPLRNPAVAWTSLPDLPLLPAMETQSKGHLRQRSLELEAVEIERRRVIVWVLAFIGRMPKCIASDPTILFALLSICKARLSYPLVTTLHTDRGDSLVKLHRPWSSACFTSFIGTSSWEGWRIDIFDFSSDSTTPNFADLHDCIVFRVHHLHPFVHRPAKGILPWRKLESQSCRVGITPSVLVPQHQCNLQLVIALSFVHHHDSHNLYPFVRRLKKEGQQVPSSWIRSSPVAAGKPHVHRSSDRLRPACGCSAILFHRSSELLNNLLIDDPLRPWPCPKLSKGWNQRL
ncbi:uncharacterized protein LACBIDRAFT_331418 [Laccaria bicolor S238N-H82]|uniref:Predicted protein n=1 Tax=Laccaria bicolor (strain S238N-H82 / ATCC MYA-4686) TaxID=486041 RepID=B0DPE6_LACBS|nr:uncharacterized protein LACBIDRAFT_331418 [Laccaria bicolor S238N-H82]EDR03669.1 predicted protein [Laccaria bicolor S238N-H82]|eukprot:XP_001885817.1 predicted protein [Laccaria bicolor S238N-H82]